MMLIMMIVIYGHQNWTIWILG